jgi:hypothetical protein
MPYFELIQIRPALFPVVPAIFGLSCFGSPARHSRDISPLRNAFAVAPHCCPGTSSNYQRIDIAALLMASFLH